MFAFQPLVMQPMLMLWTYSINLNVVVLEFDGLNLDGIRCRLMTFRQIILFRHDSEFSALENNKLNGN